MWLIAVQKTVNHTMKGCLSHAKMPQMTKALVDVAFLKAYHLYFIFHPKMIFI